MFDEMDVLNEVSAALLNSFGDGAMESFEALKKYVLTNEDRRVGFVSTCVLLSELLHSVEQLHLMLMAQGAGMGIPDETLEMNVSNVSIGLFANVARGLLEKFVADDGEFSWELNVIECELPGEEVE